MVNVKFKMALKEGFEPSTFRLTADCSTVELLQNNLRVFLFLWHTL